MHNYIWCPNYIPSFMIIGSVVSEELRWQDFGTDGQTDAVTALLDLLSPSATQVKITCALDSGDRAVINVPIHEHTELDSPMITSIAKGTATRLHKDNAGARNNEVWFIFRRLSPLVTYIFRWRNKNKVFICLPYQYTVWI